MGPDRICDHAPMTGFTTDKIGHGYLSTYMALAAMIGPKARILEIGVANGESLDMWLHLFPEGDVVGVDENRNARWPDNTTRVVADQADGRLAELVAKTHTDRTGAFRFGFDLIIDDASHNNDLTRATWINLWPLVHPGRFYVIEDWNHSNGLIVEFARELLGAFKEDKPAVADEYAGDVASITYRHGLIIMEKRKD